MSVSFAAVDDKIGTLLANRNQIVRELTNDPLLDHNENGKSFDVDIDAILKRESELRNDLHEFTALKTVSGLILEFKTNLELLELENCFYSLQALRKKLQTNSNIINKSFGLQRSIAAYVDNMHMDLINTLFAILQDGFWEINAESITFRSSIIYGEEKVSINYLELMDTLERLCFPSGRLDLEFWIISDVVLGTAQETLRDKLNIILNDYVKLSGIIEFIKSLLFAESKQVILEANDKTLLFRNSSKTGDARVEEAANSFRNLVLFLVEAVTSRDRRILSQQLGSLIATELVKFIKANSSVVFQPENSHLRDIIGDVNKNLVQLSNDSNTWSYDGVEIDRLFLSDQIPMNLQIDRVFQDQITELRKFFTDKTWRSLDTVDLTYGPVLPSQSPTHRKRPSSFSSKKSAKDNWGWDEDTGWDEHIDLDIDDKDVEGDAHSNKSKKDAATEAADDAWDEAWDIDIEGEETENQKGLDSGFDGSKIKVTQLPKKVLALISNFDQICHDSPQKIDEHYYKHKLNVLETTFMAIASRQYGENWWQLHADMKYVIQRNPLLTRLQELTFNHLDVYINTRKTIVYRYVYQQLDAMKHNERDCPWDVTIDRLLPFIQTEIIKPLDMIDRGDKERCLSSFLSFLYVDCIVKNILQWQIISERNSENLSEFVSLIYAKTEVPALNSSKSYRETREKFAIIGKFLPLHLKDIMEMFYNGDFYLFTTDELVQWIVLLFAETPLRRSAIDDIYEIRNADVSEDE